MREKALRFGKTHQLIGILSEPPPEAKRDGYPGVVLLNSGLLHRVGASRLHVQIARRLAPVGFTALRFDFSGIGDTESRRDGLTVDKSAVLEIREAMDYLEQTRGTAQFVLIGLCSGADMAFEAAKLDTRVIGVVQLDAYAYRTWKYYVYRYAPRLLNWNSWKNLISGRTYVGPAVRRLLGRDGPPPQAADNLVISPYVREFPPKEYVEEGLRALAGRGVRMFNIFSGGQEPHYNHQSQYEDSFSSVSFGNCVRVNYLGEADHTFSDLRHQSIVVNAVDAWVQDLVHTRRGPSVAALHLASTAQ